MEESRLSFEFFSSIISKESADFIRRQAKHHGISEGQALENLISTNRVNDPELAAVLGMMHISHLIKNQSIEQKNRAMFIIAGALIGNIVNTNKYVLKEAVDETIKNLNEFRRIVDNMKNEKDEG